MWNMTFDFSFNQLYIYILKSFNKEEALAQRMVGGEVFFFFGREEAGSDRDHLVACEENQNKKYFFLSPYS